jgi:hypothetical protein
VPGKNFHVQINGNPVVIACPKDVLPGKVFSVAVALPKAATGKVDAATHNATIRVRPEALRKRPMNLGDVRSKDGKDSDVRSKAGGGSKNKCTNASVQGKPVAGKPILKSQPLTPKPTNSRYRTVRSRYLDGSSPRNKTTRPVATVTSLQTAAESSPEQLKGAGLQKEKPPIPQNTESVGVFYHKWLLRNAGTHGFLRVL